MTAATNLPGSSREPVRRRDRSATPSAAGRAVLLVHGLGGLDRNWVELLPELARALPRARVDLPGHGGSGPLPRGAGIERLRRRGRIGARGRGCVAALVAGHSFGGLVALRLAQRRPELVRGLLLVSPAGIRPRRRGSPGPSSSPRRRAARPLRGALPPPLRGAPLVPASALPAVVRLRSGRAQRRARPTGCSLRSATTPTRRRRDARWWPTTRAANSRRSRAPRRALGRPRRATAARRRLRVHAAAAGEAAARRRLRAPGDRRAAARRASTRWRSCAVTALGCRRAGRVRRAWTRRTARSTPRSGRARRSVHRRRRR